MSEHAAPQLTTVHPPWQACTGVLQVVDLHAAEHAWEISPGVVVSGYAFNGQVPGPVIEATVGDTLLVGFTNLLPGPTTIHWHGLRVSADLGGMELAADPVPPGGHFQYRFDLPDAGTFWYDSNLTEGPQPEHGLYGGLVVRDPAEPVLDGERLLFFHDLQLNHPVQVAATPRLENLHGREPDALLVNGIREPKMQIPAEHVERWRLVNIGARKLRLSLNGHRFHLIGPDGKLNADPHAVDEVLMAAGDRRDLAVGPFANGQTVVLEDLANERSADKPERRTLATLQVTPSDGWRPRSPSTAARLDRTTKRSPTQPTAGINHLLRGV
jgi:FtsP/CotA-like multicopper oxidase with cupredoxin domain